MRALGKDPDDADLVELAIDVVISTREALGAVDIDRRLTELGAWGLPQALPEAEGATSTTKASTVLSSNCSPSASWTATTWLSACNALARSRRPASGSEATEARIASLLTR